MARISKALLGSPKRAVLSVLLLLAVVGSAYWFVPPVSVPGAILTTTGAGVVFLVNKYPNDAKQLLGRVLEYVAWTNQAVERESVRQDIEGTVSAGVEDLARACPDAAVARVRIDFVRSAEEASELADGTLVLGIAQHRDRTRNLVAASWAYARHGVLRTARCHLDRDVSRGIDFTVAKSILSRADSRAVNEFITGIWQPAIESESRLKELTAKLEFLEEDKLFAPILLEEFGLLGIRLVNRFPTDEVAEETARFVEHLHRVAGQRYDVDRLSFDGDWIRCGFVLLGTTELLSAKGAAAYTQPVLYAVERAYPRIYLMARGKHHVDVAREVAETVAKDPRVRGVIESAGQVLGRGGLMPRVVIRVTVDVREYVGIGQRPIVAVGNAHEKKIARDRRWADGNRGRRR